MLETPAACLAAESDSSVVVYSSEDQICSEPILHDFEHDSGIRVNAVYDKEAAEQVMNDQYPNPRPLESDALQSMLARAWSGEAPRTE